TRRVVRPVLLSACAMLGVMLVNQEVLIPRISTELLVDKDDPYGQKEIQVQGAFESNNIHIEGHFGWRKDRVIKPFFVTIPEGIARNMVHLSAAEAHYVPLERGKARTGGW